jgi:glycosyltransferase involved in cell wall biosynthesis
MKILIVQDHLRSGGTERQSVLLANAFAAAGHASTLLTFRPGGALAATVAPGVRRVALQPFDTTLDWFAPRLSSIARRLEPDAILCMGRMANCCAGQLASGVRRAIVVATMRTGKSLPWLFRRSLHRVAHVVANSREACATLVQQHHVPAEKITVIHNSLVFPPSDEGAVSSPREPLRNRHHASPSTLVLLCVAMFRPEKNQRELIEIAATLPAALDWQLWLAGDGPARAACEQLAAQKGLAAGVKFLGFQRDPSPLYGAADVAVHASSSESLSNFFIEAQAHGLPAVAYEAQGIGETFIPDRTGWVIPRGDRAAFRAALERLAAASADERAARSAEARSFARTTFDPDRQVAAYLDLFGRLVRKYKSPAR